MERIIQLSLSSIFMKCFGHWYAHALSSSGLVITRVLQHSAESKELYYSASSTAWEGVGGIT